METVKAHILRSFVQEDGDGGNAAGVVMHNGLSRDAMVQVERKLALPETAFMQHVHDGTRHGCYEALFFTPNGSQFPLCGHATIAAGWQILSAHKYADDPEYTQRYETDGRWKETRVRREGDMIYYAQEVPTHADYLESGGILRALEIDFADTDFNFPPRAMLKDAFIGLNERTFDSLPFSLDEKALKRELEKLGLVGVHLFTLTGGDPVARGRNFAPVVGIPEEPATGSANGLLAWCLHREGLLSDEQLKQTLCFVQGERQYSESSEIFVQFRDGKVWVGGRVAESEDRKVDVK